MALSATRLKDALKAAVDAITVDGGEITNDAVLLAFATEIVKEIQDNFIDSEYSTHIHADSTGGATGGPTQPPP